MNVSPDLKQAIHLFLRSYTGYLESVSIQNSYLSLVEKSRDVDELGDNVKKVGLDANARGDNRSAEILTSLHEKIRNSHFRG